MTLETHDVATPTKTASVASPVWWRRPWVLPLAVVVVGFIWFQVTPYAHEATAPLPPHDGFPLYYPTLVVHMVGGVIAMLTAVLQVWPALRRKRPAVHRASGRLYAIGVVVGGVTGLIIVRFAPPIGQIGVTITTTLWIVTTVAAVVLARRGKYELHRRFMLYSFALAMNNIWGVIIVQTAIRVNPTIDFTYLLEAARWVGWVLNLMLVQWWLYHTAGRHLGQPGTVQRSKS